jgi:hypothetical protein
MGRRGKHGIGAARDEPHPSVRAAIVNLQCCRRFDPRGSQDRRVNYRCVSQPRWVGVRRRHKGENIKGNRDLVLSCAQGGCACSRGLQAFAREREREGVRLRVSPFSRATASSFRTRALDLPFIDVRRGSRCTTGGIAVC